MKLLPISRLPTGIVIAAAALLFSAGVLANCTVVSNFAERTPDSQFVDHGNGTVTHTATATTGTGLMWKKCPQGRSGANCTTGTATLHNWQQALRAAVADTTGSYTDWRLPSLLELMSIVETGCRNPMINKTFFPLEFPQVQINAQYWSSTPGPAREAGQGWAVDFNRGSSALLDKTTSHYVRLVRLGKTNLEDNYDRITAVTGGPSPLPSFTAQTGVNTNAYIESNIVTLQGVSGSVAISISGGEYRINGGTYTTVAGTVATANTVQIRLLSAAVPSAQKGATLTINGQTFDFFVTTGNVNEPTNEGFIALADLPTNTVITSNTITLTGLTAGRTASITGDATAVFSVNGGAYAAAPVSVNNGDRIAMRITTAGTTSTMRTATLWIFGRAFPFAVTSRSGSSATEPANFVIPPKYNSPPNTLITSDTVVVTGLSSSRTISGISYRADFGSWTSGSVGNYDMSINGGGWVTSGSISNNQTLVVRGQSGPAGRFTEVRITINSRDYYFNIDAYAEPADITLREQTLVPRGAWVYSNTVQATGLLAPRAISVAGGSGQYRLSADGFTWGAWTSGAGTIGIDNYVQVRQISSTSASTATTTTLTINGRAFDFKTTTGSTLDVPSGLDFLQIYGAPLSSNVTSAVHTVAGLATSAPITVAGGAYQKNGAGGFVTAGGSVVANDTIQMQVTTGACGFSGSTATLTANGYNYPFTVWTGDGPALNAFSFPTRTNVCASAVTYSNFSPQLCSGWVGAVSIAGGTSPGYEKNDSGTYTATAGTVALNDKLRVRHTASATAGASVTTNLTVNGTVVPFTVTTRGAGASDPPAGSISFPTVQATASQVGVESAEAIVSLCTARTPTISIAGGGATPQYAVCSNEDSPCVTWGGWTTSASVATGGRAIKVRANAGGAGTTSTVTLTINAVPFTFQIQVP